MARERQLGRALERQQRLGVAVLQVIGDLARLQEHVERDDDRAGLEDAEVREREPRHVRTRQRDVIAGRDAQAQQAAGNLRRPGVELAVGDVGRTERDRDAIGRQHRLVLEDAREIEGGGVMRNHECSLCQEFSGEELR